MASKKISLFKMTSKKRSLFKTITWRITATTTTLLLVYVLSGEIKFASTVALFEVFIKLLVYYLHERAWEKVKIVDGIEYHI